MACRLLFGQDNDYLQVFDGKRCKPRDYLIRFFERRLKRSSETNPEEQAADLAHLLVLRLAESQRETDFLSRDLIGLRRFLAGRAQHLLIDERRKKIGRMRCGNCLHHRHAAGERTCDHPDIHFHWSGQVVVASEDPRRFEPPCNKYQSGRKEADSLEQKQDATGFEAAASTPTPAQELENNEVLAIAADCFAAVQSKDPVTWNIIRLFHFQKKTLAEIAKSMGVSSKTISRKKDAGMELLRAEFEQRGVTSLEGVF